MLVVFANASPILHCREHCLHCDAVAMTFVVMSLVGDCLAASDFYRVCPACKGFVPDEVRNTFFRHGSQHLQAQHLRGLV